MAQLFDLSSFGLSKETFGLGNFGAYFNYFLYILLVALIVVFYMKYRRYNIIVEIVKRVGRGIQIIPDKAGIWKDKKDGVEKFFFMKTKIKGIPVPESRFFSFTKGRFGSMKRAIVFYNPMSDKFYPMAYNLKKDIRELRPIPQDLELWRINELESAQRDYETPSFWHQYGGMIISATMLIAACFIMYMAIEKSSEVVNAIAKSGADYCSCISSGGMFK